MVNQNHLRPLSAYQDQLQPYRPWPNAPGIALADRCRKGDGTAPPASPGARGEGRSGHDAPVSLHRGAPGIIPGVRTSGHRTGAADVRAWIAERTPFLMHDGCAYDEPMPYLPEAYPQHHVGVQRELPAARAPASPPHGDARSTHVAAPNRHREVCCLNPIRNDRRPPSKDFVRMAA